MRVIRSVYSSGLRSSTLQRKSGKTQKRGAAAILDALNRSKKLHSSSGYQSNIEKAYSEGLKKQNYAGMETAAEGLKKHAGALTDTGEDSLFARAAKEEQDSTEEGGKTEKKKELLEEIEDFVSSYNTTVSRLNKADGTLDQLYRKQLSSYVKVHEKELKAVGISQSKDGTLNLDTKTLEQAELEKLKELFNGNDSFAAKVENRADAVKDNAKENRSTTGRNTYNPYGNYTNDFYSGSRYQSRA